MPEVHKYVFKAFFLSYFSTFGFFGITAWGVFNGATSPALSQQFEALPIVVRAILFAAPLAGLAAFIGTVLMFRPVSIDENGIRTYLFGRVFKSIAWSKVQRIEKCRTYDNLNERHRFVYFILTPERTIRFQEGLCELDELLKGVNQYVRQFGIETVLVDRGRDTLRAALAAATDAATRREVRRHGVRTPISAL